MLVADAPVSRGDVAALDAGEGIDVDRSVLPDASGGWVVYERMDEAFSRSELRVLSFRRGAGSKLRYSAPVRAALGSDSVAFRASPSFVRVDGASWLYYLEADAFDAPARARRARFARGRFSDVQTVALPEPLTPWSRPRWAADEAGRVAMVYRTRGTASIAFSDDGARFDAPRRLAGRTGSTPAVADIRGSGWIVAFQHGPMARKQSYVRASTTPAGSDWSRTQRVGGDAPNVHNTFPLARRDGGVDLYYLAPPEGWPGFALHRRCRRIDGSLGAPQQLVASEMGNVLEPGAARLQDGSVLVTFNEQRSGHHLHAARVTGDAPCESTVQAQ